MEIDEAPPAADKASRFRGSGTIGAPEGRGNRNAATVTVLRDELKSFAAGGRQRLRRFWLVRALAAPRGAADRKGAAVCMQSNKRHEMMKGNNHHETC